MSSLILKNLVVQMFQTHWHVYDNWVSPHLSTLKLDLKKKWFKISDAATCLLSSPSLLLLFGCLCLFMLPYQVSQVSHILICLLQQVGQASIFLLINQLTVAFFIFSLVNKRDVSHYKNNGECAPSNSYVNNEVLSQVVMICTEGQLHG